MTMPYTSSGANVELNETEVVVSESNSTVVICATLLSSVVILDREVAVTFSTSGITAGIRNFLYKLVWYPLFVYTDMYHPSDDDLVNV